MRQKVAIIAVTMVLFGASVAAGSTFFDVVPPVRLDPRVPTIDRVTGWGWGEDISDPEQVASYAALLARSAPDKARLVEYGHSVEGRPLQLLIVSSAANIARLDALRGDLDRLSDPRAVSPAEAEGLISALPAVVWVACSVHGDEASGGDAGLALAYLLAAGDSEEVRTVLDRTVVIIDPAQNPDGRARFVAGSRQARGPDPDPEPASAEHVQPWPGGRFSHDLFDLNRDWFALTQPETVGRVTAMLKWHPTVVMDLHEMGADMGYYFAPPASPVHPGVSEEQRDLWDLVGRANAAAFDAHGWRYWTREIYDAFYPGYGESWPYFSGALGVTFEQASSRGRAAKLRDGDVLTYAQTVQHHLVSSFTSVLTVSRNRGRFLRSWSEYRRSAVDEGGKGSLRAWLLEPGADPRSALALGELLALQGVEVYRLTRVDGGLAEGSVVVPLAQPLGRLAQALLQRDTPMGEAFEDEQERLFARRRRDEIYDITAWSLPLLWNVPARTISAIPTANALARVTPDESPGGGVAGEGRVAFLLPWSGPAAAQALADLLRRGVWVEVATKPFSMRERRYDRGTLVIRASRNPRELRERLVEVARRRGVDFVGTDTGFADEGIDLGSSSVRHVKPPRVAVLWDVPTSPTGAGHLRYAVERFLAYPVTPIRATSVGHVDLSDFDVIIVPDSRGGARAYAAQLGEDAASHLAAWVSDGGVLVGVGGGAEYLCSEKVGLLATKTERLGGPSEPATGSNGKGAHGATDERATTALGVGAAFDYDRFIVPEKEPPPAVPGAIAMVDLAPDDILSAGFPSGHLDVLVDSDRIFSPLKLDEGVNVGIYAPAECLRQSGFMLRASREQLPRKVYLMVARRGRGKVVGFAEDPAARGFTRASTLLLANAVLLEPAI